MVHRIVVLAGRALALIILLVLLPVLLIVAVAVFVALSALAVLRVAARRPRPSSADGKRRRLLGE